MPQAADTEVQEPLKFEVEGAVIVLIGDFNPRIFQPAWLASNGLIRDEEADSAEIKVIHHDLTDLSVGWLQLQVQPERFVAAAADAAHIKVLCDFVVGVFTILEHTPIRAMGLNRTMHYRMPSRESYVSFGDELAPKKIWKAFLDEPGLLSQTIQGKRPGKTSDYIRIKVEVSALLHQREGAYGVYFESNEHFSAKGAQQRASEFVEAIQSQGSDSFDFARSAVERILRDGCV
jgi:hypothetical protein